MVELVTLQQASLRLRLDLVDGDEREPDVQLALNQATDAVLDYLKMAEEDVVWTTDTVPFRVSAAILLLTGNLLDEQTEADLVKGLGTGDPSNPVVALLYRLRDPAIA